MTDLQKQWFDDLTAKRRKWVEANQENDFENGIKNLLTDLYPDNAHFIYELLQNAEDAGARTVRFTLTHESIEFEHDGNRLFSVTSVSNIKGRFRPMNFFIIIKVALRALARNKTRSLLTALGIIVGIAAVIAVVAIGQGATTMMMNEISGIGNNLIMVFPGSRTQGGVHAGSGASQTLTAEDGEAIARDLPHLVNAVSPMVRTGSQIIYHQNNWFTQIQGVSIDYPNVRGWEVAEGVFFTAAAI